MGKSIKKQGGNLKCRPVLCLLHNKLFNRFAQQAEVVGVLVGQVVYVVDCTVDGFDTECHFFDACCDFVGEEKGRFF